MEGRALIGGAGGLLRGLLGLWVDAVRRSARFVVALSVASAAVCAWYTATHVAINTDTAEMMSADLPFRQNELRLQQAFPQLRDPLLIVVEGGNPDLVHAGGDLLSARLRARPDLFGAIYDPAGDHFFQQNGLLYLSLDELYSLSDRLAEAQPFLGSLWNDPTLSGLFGLLGLALDQTAEGGAAPVEIAGVLSSIARLAEAQTQHRPALLSWRKLMTDAEPDAGTQRRFITVQPVLDFASLQPAAAAMLEIRRLAAEIGLVPSHGLSVRLSGTAALDHEELESVRDGLGLAGALTLVLVFGLLMLGLRSGKLVAAALLTLAVGLLWTAAFATFAVGRLNLISVAFAILFIGLSVDFGIHFSLRYREEINRRRSHEQALQLAVQGVGGALVLSAVAAAIGFFSFLPTAYVGLAELGLISGVGMFIALIANLTVLPAMLTLLPLKARLGADQGARALVPTERFLERHHRLVLLVAVVLGLSAAVPGSRARFDFDPLNLKDPNSESMRVLSDISDDPRTGPYAIAVLAGSVDQADAIAERARALPTVDSVLTLSSYLPEQQDEKLEVIASMALFLEPSIAGEFGAGASPPATRARAVAGLRQKLRAFVDSSENSVGDPNRAAAWQLITALGTLESARGLGEAVLGDLERRVLASFRREMTRLRTSLSAGPVTLDALPDDLRRRQTATDGAARIEIFPNGDMKDETALRRFVDSVRHVAPEATGAPVIIVEAGRAVTDAFLQAAVLSMVLISVLIAVLLRRVRSVVLVFAPLVLATVLTVAASVLLEQPFNFANVIVLPLLFGLGVAGGIHLVLREGQSGGGAAVMWTSTPRAVLFSALTTIGSFGSMALSSHPGTSSMGVLLTLAIVLTLVCTLLVLPALMAAWPADRRVP